VLIVGGGIASLALALMLARIGVAVDVIEPAPVWGHAGHVSARQRRPRPRCLRAGGAVAPEPSRSRANAYTTTTLRTEDAAAAQAIPPMA